MNNKESILDTQLTKEQMKSCLVGMYRDEVVNLVVESAFLHGETMAIRDTVILLAYYSVLAGHVLP